MVLRVLGVIVVPPHWTVMREALRYLAYVRSRNDVEVTYCMLLSLILNKSPPVPSHSILAVTQCKQNPWIQSNQIQTPNWLIHFLINLSVFIVTWSVLGRGERSTRDERTDVVVRMPFVFMQGLHSLNKEWLIICTQNTNYLKLYQLYRQKEKGD